MQKPAQTAHPIHDLLASRWSPRAFAERSVDRESLGSLLEAARWAPSCFNDQPWSFLVAPREDAAAFSRLSACLMEGNAWAKNAAVLMVTVARDNFSQTGKPNRHAWHDVGLAVQSLVLQAQALGLGCHQMAGFDADAARQALGIPEGFSPVTMVAIGYPGEADSLPEPLAGRETAPRARKPLEEFVFGAEWGTSL